LPKWSNPPRIRFRARSVSPRCRKRVIFVSGVSPCNHRDAIFPTAPAPIGIMTDLMNGFPPSPKTQVTLANWRTAPFNRGAFQHVRATVPSADIPHDPSNAPPLPTATMNADKLRIPNAEGRSLTLDALLRRASTDALVVLHDGRIVIERYANDMGPRT